MSRDEKLRDRADIRLYGAAKKWVVDTRWLVEALMSKEGIQPHEGPREEAFRMFAAGLAWALENGNKAKEASVASRLVVP